MTTLSERPALRQAPRAQRISDLSNTKARAKRPTKAEQRAETTEQILDEAEYLFSRHGLHGVTLKDVAKRVGVHHTLLNYYFEDKQKLFEAVFGRRAVVAMRVDDHGAPHSAQWTYLSEGPEFVAFDVKDDRVVLVREDLNVPMQDGAVTDDTRLRAAMPTVLELADRGAKVLILAHFGRPKGRVIPAMSLEPVVPHLSSALGGTEIAFAPDCIGTEARRVVDGHRRFASFGVGVVGGRVAVDSLG